MCEPSGSIGIPPALVQQLLEQDAEPTPQNALLEKKRKAIETSRLMPPLATNRRQRVSELTNRHPPTTMEPGITAHRVGDTIFYCHSRPGPTAHVHVPVARQPAPKRPEEEVTIKPATQSSFEEEVEQRKGFGNVCYTGVMKFFAYQNQIPTPQQNHQHRQRSVQPQPLPPSRIPKKRRLELRQEKEAQQDARFNDAARTSYAVPFVGPQPVGPLLSVESSSQQQPTSWVDELPLNGMTPINPNPTPINLNATPIQLTRIGLNVSPLGRPSELILSTPMLDDLADKASDSQPASIADSYIEGFTKSLEKSKAKLRDGDEKIVEEIGNCFKKTYADILVQSLSDIAAALRDHAFV